MTRLLDALARKNSGRPPIWLMRQAGRYLPQYRALKVNRSLYEMFHTVETIIEVTKLPLKLLPLDAAILFSDILTVLEGLNIRYTFEEKRGPVVHDTLDALHQNKFHYPHISLAIRELKKELKVPLLGFAGAPFTIASYIIEGGTSKDLKKTKRLLFENPHYFNTLLDQITQATIDYLNIQIDAGVDALQLFDSWANALAPPEFVLFSLKPMERIVKAVQARGIPIILFCRSSCFFAKELASIKPNCISLDWSGSLKECRKLIPSSIAIQGNLDPMALYGSKASIQQKVDDLLEATSGDPGYIFNLGHGLLPDIPFENVQWMVEHVHARFQSLAEIQ